jgi:hypothetical protein
MKFYNFLGSPNKSSLSKIYKDPRQEEEELKEKEASLQRFKDFKDRMRIQIARERGGKINSTYDLASAPAGVASAYGEKGALQAGDSLSDDCSSEDEDITFD